MIKTIKEAKSLSSSSAFIIIIVLVVVSVAAIVVGGGDGFSRKYAGIDFREFSGKMLLAQTGVVGKILEFEEDGDEFTLNLRPIELDGSVLGANERYTSTVVPPREGDTPFSYRPEEGLRVTQGYPLLREYVEQQGLTETVTQDNETLPSILGMVDCSPNTEGGFSVFFEDVAYATGVGFDDPANGVSRQNAICSVTGEFEDILLLDESGLHPGIVVQSSVEGTPEHSLSVVSPQYVGGSGFVSTLLADYLRSGVKRSGTSFTDNVSVLGVNSGFMRFNFKNVEWSLDTNDTNDFDIETVTRQNMLRLLGFGSFLGHEQENVLSSSWERWTEWDRLLFDTDYNPLINSAFAFSDVDYNNFDPGDSSNYDSRLIGESGNLGLLGYELPDSDVIPSSQSFDLKPLYISDNFQKGQSISGLADPNAVSYPILEAGDNKTVTQAEKEILCMLGLAVSGIEGCTDGPRTVSQDIYIERQNNRAVCVNLFDGLYNSFTDDFQLVGPIDNSLEGSIAEENVVMYDTPCEQTVIENIADQESFEAQHRTDDYLDAVSFSWMPSQEDSLYREYVTFTYTVKDQATDRVTDPRNIAIHKCAVTANSNQLCNGDFQYSSATSPVDFKLSSLEQGVDGDGNPIITCQSTTMPGWCAQGVQDGFSSEFGYTWHPYLIENPDAFDSEIVDSPRRYAGGSSGAIVQRLRLPLSNGTPYLVSGKVYITEDGLQPTFWYGSEGAVMKQPDGTYHVDYPTSLLGANDPVINEYVLSEPLVAGQWHTFAWTLNPGMQDITHVAFGGSSNTGFILYDDLSIQNISECGDCFSDMDGDCVTNTNDLLYFFSEYSGECANDSVGCVGDLTFDGLVNTADLLEFFGSYGGSCLVDDEIPVDDGENVFVINNTDYFCVRDLTCYNDGLAPAAVQSSDLRVITLVDGEISGGLDVDIRLLSRNEIVPNSGGFSANFVMTVANTTRQQMDDVSVIGVLPSMMTYEDHVSTEENVAYDRESNSIMISEVDNGQEVIVYFRADINQSICAQLEREVDSSAYSLLIDLDLCDSYQILLEKQYGIQRDKFGNIIRKGGGGSNDVIEDEGDLGGVPNCNDGIDNDSDGYIDFSDGGCNLDPLGNESDAFAGEVTQCNDGIDNDGDTRIDLQDLHCQGRPDNYEGNNQ